MTKIKLLANIVYWMLFVSVVVFALFMAFSVYEAPGGYRVFTVLTGSMQPAIKTNSVVLIKSQPEYAKGDIITFLTDPNANIKNSMSVVTHRVDEVNRGELPNELSYTTKGDANATTDLEAIPQKQVLGKVQLVIPLIGKFMSFARTQTGFTILVVIPAVILIYNEINNIKKEGSKLVADLAAKLKKRKQAGPIEEKKDEPNK